MTPAWARKSSLVLLIAVLALAVFGTTTQTWINITLDPDQVGQTAGGQNTLPVQGSKAATAVTALALVALAGGLAASIAGKGRALGHHRHRRPCSHRHRRGRRNGAG